MIHLITHQRKGLLFTDIPLADKAVDAHFILSGNDLVAQEFATLIEQDAGWRSTCKRPAVSIRTLADANHTFSNRDWRATVETWTASHVIGSS